MATIKELIERIETRLFMLSGLDVQIHAEGQLEEMLRGVYNTLFDDFWYPEYTFPISATLDGATGCITSDISTKVLRYKDIHSVYHDEEDKPLPRVTPGTAYQRIRTRSIIPSVDPRRVFQVIPITTTGPVHIWYRTRITDAVWATQAYDTVVNMDDDVLMYGVVYEFLVNDDSNQRAAAEYKNKYLGRQQQMRDAQWQQPISKRRLEQDGPLNRWE